jgi:hypothetical protein
MPDGPAPLPRRGRLRLRVIGLIALMFLIGAWFGWIARSARIQREAVAAIKYAGGTVRYEGEWEDGGPASSRGSWAPHWLVKAIGVDYFVRVKSVGLTGGAGDAEFAQVGRLGALVQLSLDGTDLSDAGLARLKDLSSLERLDIRSDRVTDAGLVHLKWLLKLSYLKLSCSQVSDSGMAELKVLTHLAALHLDDTPITDSGLARLKGLTNLTELDVSGTQVTDVGMTELQQALPGLLIFGVKMRHD